MAWIKATYKTNDFHDGETELFNVDQIMNITPDPKRNAAKILMGAGLHWQVYLDSIEFFDNLPDALREGVKEQC